MNGLRDTCNNDPPGAAVSNDDDIDNSVDNSIPEGERANGAQILQHSAAQQHDTAQHHVRPDNNFEIDINSSALCSLASKVSCRVYPSVIRGKLKGLHIFTNVIYVDKVKWTSLFYPSSRF